MNKMKVLCSEQEAGQKKEMMRDYKSLYSKRPDCKSARTGYSELETSEMYTYNTGCVRFGVTASLP